jgi:hypothetical protein
LEAYDAADFGVAGVRPRERVIDRQEVFGGQLEARRDWRPAGRRAGNDFRRDLWYRSRKGVSYVEWAGSLMAEMECVADVTPC